MKTRQHLSNKQSEKQNKSEKKIAQWQYRKEEKTESNKNKKKQQEASVVKYYFPLSMMGRRQIPTVLSEIHHNQQNSNLATNHYSFQANFYQEVFLYFPLSSLHLFAPLVHQKEPRRTPSGGIIKT